MSYDDRITKQTVQVYRHVFGRDDAGRQVLTWLLERGFLFQRIDDEEQRVIHNQMVTLLENMGITQGPINYRALVDAMLSLAVPDEAIGETDV